MKGRDRRFGGSWLVPSLRVGLPVALAAGAVVLLARLVSQDAALVAAPMVTIVAVALLVGRAATQRRRQLGRVRRRLRQRLDLIDRRQARQGRAARREAERLYGRLEALTALRDTLHGRIVVPSTTDWAASADLLRELASIVMARRPRVVVETGSGTSTVVIAGCLERLGDGHLWSLEHLPSFARGTQDLLAASGVQDRATIVDAPLVDVRLGEGTGGGTTSRRCRPPSPSSCCWWTGRRATRARSRAIPRCRCSSTAWHPTRPSSSTTPPVRTSARWSPAGAPRCPGSGCDSCGSRRAARSSPWVRRRPRRADAEGASSRP